MMSFLFSRDYFGTALRAAACLIALAFTCNDAACFANDSDPEGTQFDGSRGNRPNILFAISDDQSFPHASAYGCQWVDTPAFDRVAKAGLLFNQCYTPNAKCAPSRACLLTGRYSWQLEEAANHWCYFPEKFRSYVEALGDAGYRTGMTGKGWAPGVAVDSSGRKRELAGQPFSRLKAKPPTRAISSNDYAANFTQFLEETSSDEPFCFWFGCTEPHRGYDYGTGVSVGGKSLRSIDQVPSFWPDNEIIRNDMLDYALEIEHFDRHLGLMLDELEERGLLDNTLVVVTADNGMPFPRVKGQSYDWSHHLPLAICWADGITNPGRQVDQPVSFIDLAPTYLEVAGLGEKESQMASLSGRSLVSIFRDQEAPQERGPIFIGKERHDIGRPGDVGYPVRGIIENDFLLIRNFEPKRWPAGNPQTGYLNTDGSPTKTEILLARRVGEEPKWWQLAFGKRPEFEMYNLATDRDCLVNLADIPRYAQQKEKMLKKMNQALVQQGDPRVLGRGEIFDHYLYANERERGFFEKYLADPSSIRAGWVNPIDFETEDLETFSFAPQDADNQ